MIKEVKKRKKIISMLMVTMFMIGTFFVAEQVFDFGLSVNVRAVENWANETYSYRSLITIDKDQVPSQLSNFPVLVVIYENESIYDSMQDNHTGIAFYSHDDNTTEYAFECESYYKGGGVVTAYFWVNVTTVYSTKNTYIWFYYGGNSVDASNPNGTWNSGYDMVYHMNQNSDNIQDSTNNNRDATADIDDGSLTYEQTGQVSYCIDFGREASFIMPEDFMGYSQTFEAWLKFDDFTTNYQTPLTFYNEVRHYWYYDNDGSQDKFLMNYQYHVETWESITFDTGSDIGTTNFHYFASSYENSTSAKAYIDGGLAGEDNSVGEITEPSGSNRNRIGCYYDGVNYGFDGKIDEVRISNVVRSQAWLTASYNTMNNKTGAGAFASFGLEEENSDSPSSATLTLNNNKFTHQGETGNTTLSNETGTKYETANISFSYNGTQVIGFVQINVSDIHANITSDEVHLQFTSDNSSWNKGGNWKTGASGGWSIILNSTTWTNGNGCYGANPFPINDNTSYIYWRTKITIPEAIGNETYSNTAMTWRYGYYQE